jgi:hypothetical protein
LRDDPSGIDGIELTAVAMLDADILPPEKEGSETDGTCEQRRE